MYRVILFLSFICFNSISSSAQDVQLTLQECVKLAFENNLELRKTVYDTRYSDIELKESKFAQLPNLNLSSSGSYFSGRVVDPTTNDFITESFISNDVSLNSNIILYNGGRLRQQVKQSKIDQKISSARLNMTRDNIGLAVINSFLNVVLFQENLANAKGLLKITEDQKFRLMKQVEVGARSKNELLNVDVQLAQDEENVVNLENELIRGRLQLSQLIRWEGENDFKVVSPALIDISQDAMDMYSFEVVYEMALATQPSIKAAQLGEDKALSQVKMAKSGFYPSLSATAVLNTRYSDAAKSFNFEDQWFTQTFRINGQTQDVEILQSIPTSGEKISLVDQWDQNLGYGIGLNLNVPIFNRWSTSANVQRAKIQKETATIDTEVAKDNLKMDVQNALASASGARSNYEAAQKTFTVAKNAFDSNTAAYDVGALSIYELTQSRINMDNAQRSVLTSKYNYIFRIKVLDFYLGRELNLE